MGILDIVVIVFLVIFLIFGFIKGFVKQIVKAASGIIAFGLAVAFCKKVGGLLFDTTVGTKISNYFYNYLASKGELFTKSGVSLTEEVISQGLSEAGIPAFLHKLIIGSIDLSKVTDISLGEYLATALSNAILVVLSFIVIYLVVFLLVKLLGRIIGGAVRGSALGLIDGFLGAVWSLVKATFILSCLFLILSFVCTLPFGESINAWITNDMKLTEEGFGIAKFLYQNNPILFVLDKLNISSTIDSIFSSSKESFKLINNYFFK